MLSLMLRGSISIPRIPIPRVAILSIRAAICRILQLQRVVLSGIREDNISRVRLPLAVQGLRDSRVSPVRDVVLRDTVFGRAEAAADVSRARGVFTIFLYRTLRTTQT